MWVIMCGRLQKSLLVLKPCFRCRSRTRPGRMKAVEAVGNAPWIACMQGLLLLWGYSLCKQDCVMSPRRPAAGHGF